MLIVNKHCAIFTNLHTANTLEGPEGVRLIPEGVGWGTWLNLPGMCRWRLRAPTPL